MIVLDTNVISEVLKPRPSEKVSRWLSDQEAASVFISAVTEAEILYGIQLLPPGKRRARLSEAVGRIFMEEFSGRILPFDSDAAREFGTIAAARKVAGRPISLPDAFIAAVARSHRASLATRNIADFELCGIRLVDPWTLS